MELQYKFIESMWSNLQRTKVGKKVVSSESENFTIRNNKRKNKEEMKCWMARRPCMRQEISKRKGQPGHRTQMQMIVWTQKYRGVYA